MCRETSHHVPRPSQTVRMLPLHALVSQAASDGVRRIGPCGLCEDCARGMHSGWSLGEELGKRKMIKKHYPKIKGWDKDGIRMG